MKWLFTDHEGVEWVIEARDAQAAQAAVHVYVKRQSGSIAAGMVAARSVVRY